MTTNRGRTMRAGSSLLLSTLLWLAAWSAGAHDEGRARYLGNEGVLVTHGDTRILFDAFYANSYGHYLLVDDRTIAALHAGEPPWDGIDALLVSHVHGDHFSAAPTVAYLRAQPGVRLYASSQVRDAMVDLLGRDDPVLDRVQVVDVAPQSPPHRLRVGDLEIATVAIPHAGGAARADIINLAFRVTLDDALTVLHLGDADPGVEHFVAHADHWAERRIDAVFPPYWFFGSADGRRVLADQLGATRTIGIHVPAEALGHGDAWRERVGGDLFTDPGEERPLPHAGDR